MAAAQGGKNLLFLDASQCHKMAPEPSQKSDRRTVTPAPPRDLSDKAANIMLLGSLSDLF